MTVNQKLKFLYAANRYLNIGNNAKAKHYNVLMALLWHCKKCYPATCVPSHGIIAEVAKIGTTTVKEVLHDLYSWGIVTIENRFKNSNIYTISWEHLAGAEKLKAVIKEYDYEDGAEHVPES